jgi:REP element-mobilizing transposase RayT
VLACLGMLPRQVLPRQFYLITRRCTQRQFLLRPDSATNNAFLYCLIDAASRCDIDVLLPCAMSNHYHVVIYDRAGRYPEFIEHFHKLLARSQNALRGRWENFWSSEQTCVVECPGMNLRPRRSQRLTPRVSVPTRIVAASRCPAETRQRCRLANGRGRRRIRRQKRGCGAMPRSAPTGSSDDGDGWMAAAGLATGRGVASLGDLRGAEVARGRFVAMKCAGLVAAVALFVSSDSMAGSLSGKVVTEQIVSKILHDNLVSLNETRRVMIYLPPGYETSRKRYPVAYYFHSISGSAGAIMEDGRGVPGHPMEQDLDGGWQVLHPRHPVPRQQPPVRIDGSARVSVRASDGHCWQCPCGTHA